MHRVYVVVGYYYLGLINIRNFDSTLEIGAKMLGFKVAQNRLQHFQERISLVITTTLYWLMLKSWYQNTTQSLVNMLLSIL